MTVDVRGSSSRSWLRRLGLSCALLGVALSLFVSASKAEAAGSGVEWQVAGSPLTGTATYGLKSPGGLTLVGILGGASIRLHASGAEVISPTMLNEAGSAVSRGKIRLTGVTVVALATCAVKGGSITSVETSISPVWIGSNYYEQITPRTGGTFFTVVLTSGTGSCPIEGSYTAGGQLFAKVPDLRTEAVSHELQFSGAIENQVGGKFWFMDPNQQGELNGSMTESLTGAYAGQAWSAKFG